MAKSYALWLVPSGEVYDNLKGLIPDLSRRNGTVDFEPHITLIGGLEGEEKTLISKAHLLGATPFNVRLSNLEHSGEYFKCVFLNCEMSGELEALSNRARTAFGVSGESEFSPHLSLLYGNLRPDLRETIVRELAPRSKDPIEFAVSGVRFMLTEKHPAVELKAFSFSRERSR